MLCILITQIRQKRAPSEAFPGIDGSLRLKYLGRRVPSLTGRGSMSQRVSLQVARLLGSRRAVRLLPYSLD